MLFYTDHKHTAVLHEDCIKLCPQLKKLSKDELLFVILAVDHLSPYNQFGDEERVRKAKRHVFKTKDTNVDNTPKVIEAMKEYMSLQYDQRRETVKNYKKKIDLITKDLVDETSSVKIKQYVETIRLLEDNCIELQQKIDFDVQQAELKGGGKKSLLEQMQDSRELYELSENSISDNIKIVIDYPEDHEE